MTEEMSNGPVQTPVATPTMPDKVFARTSYVDVHGREITSMCDLETHEVFYLGRGDVQVIVQGRTGTIAIQFSVPGADVYEAFRNYEQAFIENKAKVLEEINRPKIIAPASMGAPNLKISK